MYAYEPGKIFRKLYHFLNQQIEGKKSAIYMA